MKRTILCTALILTSLQLRLSAQQKMEPAINLPDRSSKTFTLLKEYVNIRDFVTLKNDNKIIFELDNVDDYKRLKNLDSILNLLKDDIAFYKDSLTNSTGSSVRIDYYINTMSGHRQIRFKKYSPDGDIFMYRNGDLSRLKIEGDTIQVLMYVRGEELDTYMKKKGSKKTSIRYVPHYTIAVTFCMNNYSDLDEIIANKELLHHIVDTLYATKRKSTISDPVKFPSTTIYKPYMLPSFKQYNGVMLTESPYPRHLIRRSDQLTLGGNIGLGLIRNTLAPNAELSLSLYNRRSYNAKDINTHVTLSVSPYFFFDRGAGGDYYVHDNWFVNFYIGGASDFLIKTKLLTGGVGYLFAAKGDYFKGTTMKAFLNISLNNLITISPEIIFTNDFKQIFPGITLKVF